VAGEKAGFLFRILAQKYGTFVSRRFSSTEGSQHIDKNIK